MKKTAFALLTLFLFAGAASASDAPYPSSINAKSVKPKARPAAKVELGEGSVVQNELFVRLNRPVSISLFNTRGELLFHMDSFRVSESFPLAGVNAGFLYLTLRAGSVETTQKLVYTGK
jgi:hypothetical protein